MTNKGILLTCVGALVSIFVCCIVYWGYNKIESGCGYVIVDGSSLRISNEEFIVTNLLSLCVKPTKKTSEWIYVHGGGCEIWINEHRLEITETSLRHFYNGREEVINGRQPVLFRFFENEVVIYGTHSSMKERIRIENIRSLYNVRIQVDKVCRIVIKANWYEYTG